MNYDQRSASLGFKTIDTAPRDGTEICVTAEGEPLYLMSWNQFGTNDLVQAERGIWWGRGGGFTWSEKHGHGPTHWAAADNPLVAVLMQQQASGSMDTPEGVNPQ
jgi:hypothetical protein